MRRLYFYTVFRAFSRFERTGLWGILTDLGGGDDKGRRDLRDARDLRDGKGPLVAIGFGFFLGLGHAFFEASVLNEISF